MPNQIIPPTPSLVPGVPTEQPGGWRLIWKDEFDTPSGTPPDPAIWKYDLGGDGWGNQEWEYYTDRVENAAINGSGSLVIRALEILDPEASGLECWYGPCCYTSARLLTKDRFTFTYGHVEARIKVPFGQGLWPAVWMLGDDIPTNGWPACGEIDIMEYIGREPGNVYGTVHGPGYFRDQGISHKITLPDGQVVQDDFHVFAVEWEPEEIRWYMDGELYGTLCKDSLGAEKPWVFDHPFFILMNVAVGGLWPDYPDRTTIFPQEMLVDYVRVYQK